MRGITSLIASAAITLHFGLGCCAHHAHAAERGECAGHAHSASDCSHDQDGQDESSSTPDDSDAPQGDCHEGQCDFLASVRVVPTKEISTQWLPAVVPELATKLVASFLASSLPQAGTPPPLPVRLHLFHQMFLI